MIIPDMYIYVIDALIVFLYVIMIISGYKKGFLFELISVFYNIASIIVAWLLCPVLAVEFPLISMEALSNDLIVISHFINLGPLINSFVYFILIFLVLRIIYVLIGLLTKSVNSFPVIGFFNKLCGALMGILNATIIVMMLSLILVIPVFNNGRQIRNKTIFKYIENYSDMALDFITDNMDLEQYKNKYDDFDVDQFRSDVKEWIDGQRQKQ